MKIAGTRTLGPGDRYGLWLQGCNRRCHGCVAPNSWDISQGEEISVEVLALKICQSGCNGLTISGGEPFLQSEELYRLICKVKEEGDMGIIVFSGYTLAQLQDSPDENVQKILQMIDVLIDGEYIEELDDDKPYRGSSNQKIHFLTSRYSQSDFNNKSRENDFILEGDKIITVGIPSKITKMIKKKITR
ncbi:MAG: 4Fe-4S single cluster domain-containing protein [Candidatus Coproplasma sp.]